MAQYFTAWTIAVKKLVQYYRDLSATPAAQCSDNLEFLYVPYPATYTSLNTKELVHFQLTSEVDKANKTLMYHAKQEDGKEITMKYVWKYSVKLHQFCTSKGHAPTLLGYDELPGNWWLVVMKRMTDHIDYSKVLPCDRHLYVPGLIPRLKKLVESFHRVGLVHGDIRDTNLLVNVDKVGFMLIDFDWGGEVGTVRYPIGVNKKVGRPDDVHDIGDIKPEHDLYMINGLSK